MTQEERNYFEEIKNINQEVKYQLKKDFIDNGIDELIFNQPLLYKFVCKLDGIIEIKELYGIILDDNELYLLDSNEIKIHVDDLIASELAEIYPYIKKRIERRKEEIEKQEAMISSNKEVEETTKKMCFLPIKFCGEEMDDETFYEKSLHFGKVMTMEEYVSHFNSNCYTDIAPNMGQMRVIDVYKKVIECCPHCGYEVLLDNVLKNQICPICNRPIKPCSLCRNCTGKCPLDKK